MELLAIPLGFQKTAAKWLVISWQKTPAKYTRKGYAVIVRG
jgi:hypothetical protein